MRDLVAIAHRTGTPVLEVLRLRDPVEKAALRAAALILQDADEKP